MQNLSASARAGRNVALSALAIGLVVNCSGAGSASGTVSAAPTPAPTATATPTPSPSPTLTATQFAAQMAPGWNLGNTLEAIGTAPAPATTSQETAWGNPAASQALLNAVAAAGFKSIRVPVSWKQYADANDRIGSAWFDRVAQVVDQARQAGLVVIINVHWDGGWLQPTYADQGVANARLKTFWTQIATRFRDYDDHLLFAGTNEVMVKDNYNAPTAEHCAVQNGFNKVFVDAVRATGGGNANRYLIVQGFNTNIDHTIACNSTLPTDSVVGRMMMEVHYYDPYDFALNEKSTIWQWGAGATDPKAAQAWANEQYVDATFQKVKVAFGDRGIPVILGEYGAIAKTEYDPTGKYRTEWDRYVTRSAVQHGMVPIYWDNGPTGNHTLGLFDRATGRVVHSDIVQAIVGAAK
ncbi:MULTISPECIES: glycoside hydrolase family 5 protein [unclassified Sphingomonas]|uniref:glycoside hydrolase family 5 protein n=1 Tax=unclassified Sphingomonas TaxID=196159 RepID=UPI0007004BF4|nr:MULTISPECIES: glycoside hydrolase family 5 protein [unclassified Sphingomonas]KQM66224.1 endoglucanase [Sphingomonas sp. Leaf16]KQN08680.1 endoglucanase [Sphingomonas sp. Leaf29]KQN17260.1 endoglucanase [Sphingomonas sp. Leaf32]